MDKKERKSFFSATATISGTAIGAGYLGIPYVISKPGFLIGLFYLILLGLVTLFFKLCLGEIILRTKGNHQLTGYAQKYTGKTGKNLMLFSMAFGIYSALIAYLIASGQSISYIAFGNFNYSIYFSLVFWLILSIFTYIGLKALKVYEKIGILLVFAMLLIIIFSFSGGIKIENLSYIKNQGLLLPMGVILFSFLGFSSIPEARRLLINKEKHLKKSIIYGILIPMGAYIIFTTVTLGNFGNSISEVATFSLGRFFSLIAVITMFNSYFSQTIAIRDMFRFDYNLGRFKGWILGIFIPVILFLTLTLLGWASFIEVMSIAGIISIVLTGILILYMRSKSRILGNRKPEYVVNLSKPLLILITIVFIIAVLSSILRYF